MKVEIHLLSNISKRYLFFGSLLFLFTLHLSYAQNLSLSDLETDIRFMQLKQENLNRAKDSLDLILKTELDFLDQLKGDESSGTAEITQQMARTLSLTQQLDALKVEQDDLQQQVLRIQSKLRQKYNIAIDSLSQVLNDTEPGPEKNTLSQKIMALSGKRLRITPLLSGLSFDLQKIEEYDPQNISDSLETVFYQNYLQLALADLDSHIVHLQAQEDQLTENLRLQQKREIFLDDISDSYVFGIDQQSSTDPSAIAGPGKDYEGRFNSPANDQIDNYLHMINQMHTSLMMADASSNSGFDPDEYIEMIQRTRGLLEKYKQMIENKLNRKTP